jgi:SAM-dependent methyltransferase
MDNVDSAAPSAPASIPPSIPPSAQMHRLLLNGWMTQALSAVARLGVPTALGEKIRPAADLAAEVGADPDTLHRVMRALTEIGIFTHQDEGFGLTELGATLRRDVPGSLATLATMVGSDWQLAATGGLYESIRTGFPPGPTLWEGGMFGYLDAHPDDAAIFNGAMVEIAASTTAAVATGYDFGRFGTLVDVGGGQGYLIGAILAAHPQLRGVLLDQPSVIGGASRNLERLGVLDRCATTGGDFFDAVPAGQDGYLLSNVLHDWDDERALRILRSCAAAMRPDSTLLISEWVLPERPGPAPVAHVLDLGMLILTDGGRERTPDEFRGLLGAAGLQLDQVTRFPFVRPSLLTVTKTA